MPDEAKHLLTTSSKQSFVYPTRSLLSAIQPAPNLHRSSSADQVATTPGSTYGLVVNPDPKPPWLPQEVDNLLEDGEENGNPSKLGSGERGNKTRAAATFTCLVTPQTPENENSPSNSSEPVASLLHDTSHVPYQYTNSSLKRKISTPNFSHFPAEQGDPNIPRTFSTVYPVELTSLSPDVALEPASQLLGQQYESAPLPIVVGPALTASVFLLPPLAVPPSPLPTTNASYRDITDYIEPQDLLDNSIPPNSPPSTSTDSDKVHSPIPFHEKSKTPKSSFTLESLPPVDAVSRSESSTTVISETVFVAPNLPFNPSQYGLVHLPPLHSPGTSERRSGSISNRSSPQDPSPGKHRGSGSASSDHSANGGSDSIKYFSASSEPMVVHTLSGTASHQLKNASSCEVGRGNTSDSNGGHSQSGSQFGNESLPSLPNNQYILYNSQGSKSSGENRDYLACRFQYAQDEHGNHVVVGREGRLQRCEDEPIHTPGAVQGFGVLVAVEIQEDIMLVKQVSENSAELLGLSPHYLFSLECFTDTLLESSAGTLWDNVQYLLDPIYVGSEEDNSPQVFTLSGWGEPGSVPLAGDMRSDPLQLETRRHWTCWCGIHKTSTGKDKPGLIVIEFELEHDIFNPLYPPVNIVPLNKSRALSSGSENRLKPHPIPSHLECEQPIFSSMTYGAPLKLSQPGADDSKSNATSLYADLQGQDGWMPSADDVLESTTNHAKPLPALERMRRLTQKSSPFSGAYSSSPSTLPQSAQSTRKRRRHMTSSGTVGMMDVFAAIAQNEQIGAAQDLSTLLNVTFDENWNGQVVAELVDRNRTNDLYKGLHFPAADIPKQARDMYMINKVRILYDRSQPTARMVVRSKEDLEKPLNMTYCYLRAMSPIHIKYLENMGVRASMSVSIMAFDQLWGLIACHSYGDSGMRVSFPVRQMLRVLSQSISRNIERLSYPQRLHTRKLINTLSSDQHPTGYIVSNADDLLGLFDADFGILVIGEGAKILGSNQHGQEILIMAEYLRLKQFHTIQVSQAVINDFPDLQLTAGFEVIAGLLYVPLSSGGTDFIAFLRQGQMRDIRWAGKPYKNASHNNEAYLEPRKSFKTWSETVIGRSRVWTNEQLETAGVLALVYGKFIEVWRQKQSALQTTKLTNLLLSNATHEVRTPLNHIINYLEMAMNGPLDHETRDNLVQSHVASKSLLFTINDLLDLTRLESGNETYFNEPLNLHRTIQDAVLIYQKEAARRNIGFVVDVSDSPTTVIGDSRKIRTVVQNLTANALKYTTSGNISVSCQTFSEPEGLRDSNHTAVEIVVVDTGCGIEECKLEKIFREFEQVESSENRSNAEAGVGLGLAVVARIVEQLGGQLRVDSKVNEGSRFSFLIPLALSMDGSERSSSSSPSTKSALSLRSQPLSQPSSLLHPHKDDIDSLVEALSSNKISSRTSSQVDVPAPSSPSVPLNPGRGAFEVAGSSVPVQPVKIDPFSQEVSKTKSASTTPSVTVGRQKNQARTKGVTAETTATPEKLRILIVEDNDINRNILAKRLTMQGHAVVNATNGQEGIDTVKSDDAFDVVLMDIQMPIVDGFKATQQIRVLEKEMEKSPSDIQRLSHRLNGRIPIFAVSASLLEQQRGELGNYGMDGWILKPIDFKRLNILLSGVTDTEQRNRDVYQLGGSWEVGGWLKGTTNINVHDQG